jgi:4-aminobutyrate aminotransferase-like enzyme
LSKFPPSLNRIFFVNSGSAATDLAVRLAEAYTGRCEYLVLDYAYHGNTRAAIGLSPYKFNRKGGKGKPDNVIILDGSKTIGNKGEINLQEISGDVPYTFFAESIVGCAGQIVLSSDFMQKTVSRVRSAGGIYVADEVQTGFARVGHSFWAYELYDVIPDMVILGKPMGNGHPMGAVVCTEAIAKSFETGMEFFSSFGGNPVSCVIGSAVLDVIEEEGLQQNALTVGEYLLNEMGFWKNKENWLPDVSDFVVRAVRGSGLFLGIELLSPANGLPATKATVEIVNKMKDRGFLLSTDGPYNNVIKFKPPMCFTMENAGELIRELSSVMAFRKLTSI